MKLLRRVATWIIRFDAEALGFRIMDDEEFEGIWACAVECGRRTGYEAGVKIGHASALQPRERNGRYTRKRLRVRG